MATNIDYPAMLADMESKRDSLIASIANLRAFLGLPAQGNGDTSRSSGTLGQSTSMASDLPKGALLNKSIPEAVKLYLKSVAAKRTTREITEALQAHGVESLSSNFSGIVFTALKRLKQSQEVLQFEEGWGLAEFYPAHIRAALTDAPSNKPKKKSKPKGKARAQASKSPKPSSESEPETKETTSEPNPAQGKVEPRLEAFVSSLESPRTSAEIAAALNITGQTAGLLLSKLAYKGRITKTESGKFGPKTNAHEMPKAS
jgi:hypothetical protein